jgi:hypothetical protein
VTAVLDTGLRDALRALKLTGILTTLDERLAQARDGRLGHVEVLQLLLEDELAHRCAFPRAPSRRVSGGHTVVRSGTAEGSVTTRRARSTSLRLWLRA